MREAARAADGEDLPVVAELYAEALASLAHERGGALLTADRPPEAVRGIVAARLAEPSATVVVGTLDDVVVGFGVATLTPLGDGRRTAEVEALYVVPDAREIGVGELVLGAVVEWAASHGAVGVDLAVLPGVRATKNFLEGEGFTARLLVMHKPLDPA